MIVICNTTDDASIVDLQQRCKETANVYWPKPGLMTLRRVKPGCVSCTMRAYSVFLFVEPNYPKTQPMQHNRRHRNVCWEHPSVWPIRPRYDDFYRSRSSFRRAAIKKQQLPADSPSAKFKFDRVLSSGHQRP